MKPKFILRRAHRAILSGMGLILTATICHAQALIQSYDVSLEARIAQAQSVFRGSISNLTRTVIIPTNGFMTNVEHLPGKEVTNKSVVPDGVVQYTLAVSVDEVIKMPPRGNAKKFPPATVQFILQATAGNKEIEQWAAQHTSFLCFYWPPETIRPNPNESPTSWDAIRRIPFHWNAIRLGEAALDELHYNGMIILPPIYLMDSAAISDPKEILAHARALGKRKFPSTNVYWLPNSNSFGYLQVPVTSALEKWAHERMKSGDQEGVKALQFFKSAKNIRLLKPLLNDTNFSVWRTGNQPWNDRQVYDTRKAAYELLTNWGVNVPKPVTEVELPWHYDPSVREKLEVEYPTNLWVRRGELSVNGSTNTLELGMDIDGRGQTNVLIGSNMITGTRFEWYVYPAGEPRPARPTRLEQQYWPTTGSWLAFAQDRNGLPVPGQKYTLEVDFTIFETDNPPQDVNTIPLDVWRPQDGKNYRVLLERKLRGMSE